VSLTNVIIGLCVIAYVWELSIGGPGAENADLYGPAVMQQGQWWRIFTAAFLHGSLLHIGLNMLALFQVGNMVEQLFGKIRFLLLYVVAIVGSGFAVVYFNYDTHTLGASGAIFGLFGALVAVGLRLGARGRALVGQVVPVIVINLVFTFSIPNISAAAHVGGLITGFLAGLLLFRVPRPPQYAYVYATPGEGAREVETIEQPPAAAPHEAEGVPPLEVRDPRE
jgi:rhomboid protease GluP